MSVKKCSIVKQIAKLEASIRKFGDHDGKRSRRLGELRALVRGAR